MRKIIPDDRVRQGPAGRPVLGVLVAALLLCAVALGGFMLWAGTEAPEAPREQAAGPGAAIPVDPPTGNPTDRVAPANPAYPVPAEPSATGTTSP